MIESGLLERVSGYVNGSWVGADDGATFAVRNPVSGALLAEVPSMGGAETKRALDGAAEAVDPTVTLATRRGWLTAITSLLADHERELGRLITLENGKPLKESCAEVAYAAGFFRYAAEHLEVLEPRELSDRPRGLRWTVHHRPAGVGVLITPWNFPVAMVAKKLSAALAAACPTVTKPAGQTPLSMIGLFHLLERVGLPRGMANLVMGGSVPIGRACFEHPAVRVVSFTGSTAVGRILIGQSAGGIKRLSLELGGNAPFIVFADADLDLAAEQLMVTKFRAGGQTCVCANRILVERSVMDSFTERVSARVSALRVGDGMEEGTDIGPLIDRAGWAKVASHVRDATDRGARCVVGGLPAQVPGEFGCFFPPTVLTGVTPSMACAREETFGPLVPIMPFDTEAAAIAMANDTEYGLASYLFTRDGARADRVAAALRFGHVACNSGSGPTPEAPFGGMKQSGYGREGGLEGLFEFVERQTVAGP